MNDITSERSRKYKNMVIWGDFQGITRVTREENGSKNWKTGLMSFMDNPVGIIQQGFFSNFRLSDPNFG